MNESTGTEFVRSLFRGAAHRYDPVVRTTTLGMDVLWKRRLLQTIPSDRTYDRILDLACGTGIVTFALADRFPEAEIVGVDLSREMLSIARQRSHSDRIQFIQMRAEDLDCLAAHEFDLVTASYLPKYVAAGELAENVSAVLTDNGVAVFHDFTYPESRWYRAGFELYWALLRRGLIHLPGFDEIATELRPLIVDSSGWPERLGAALERVEFNHVEIASQPLEIAAIVTAVNEVEA